MHDCFKQIKILKKIKWRIYEVGGVVGATPGRVQAVLFIKCKNARILLFYYVYASIDAIYICALVMA